MGLALLLVSWAWNGAEADQTAGAGPEIKAGQQEWALKKAELIKEAEILEKQVRQLDDELAKTIKYEAVMRKKVQDIKAGAAKQEQLLLELAPLLEAGTRRLSRFVEADLPFDLDRRRALLARVTAALDDPDLGLGDKISGFLDALYHEVEYGYRVGTETTEVDIDHERVRVHLLHYGRIGLLAQALDGNHIWVWNRQDGKFHPTTGHGRAFRRARAVVLQHRPAELVRLPVDRAETR